MADEIEDREERLGITIAGDIPEDLERLLAAKVKYRQAFSEEPPSYAFQGALDNAEWAEVLEAAVKAETSIDHTTIERFTGERIAGEGSYKDEDQIEDFMEEARKANE